MRPQLVMLAGPNGAGKSTFYDVFLADSPLPFLNADLFAAETGFGSFEAARILDATRDRMIEDGLGFITETVFSDPYGEKLGMLRKATDADWDVTLIYIGIAGPELSARRVDLRQAIAFIPAVELFDNSNVAEPYRHLASFRNGALERRAKGTLPTWCRRLLATLRR